MTRQLVYIRGDNYFLCPVCGRKKRVSKGRRRWDNEFVCTDDWEPRHPQEFVRGRADKILPSITRPEPADTFIDVGDVTAEDL